MSHPSVTQTVAPGDDGGGRVANFFGAGTRIAGRYEVLRVLGTGGFATVYAVRDLTIDQEIALKVLRSEDVSEVSVERSRRELKGARKASSERLAQTYDLHGWGGLLFFSMELVPGGTLRDLLRKGPLPVAEAVRLADEILEALAALDTAGIVHRDVKPANLLLTGDGHIKLSDFGICLEPSSEQARLTLTDKPLGTFAYISPEQALGRDVDRRSDLYSFGVVLFEMLAGRLPFRATSTISSVVLRIEQRPPDVRQFRPEVPRWLARIVARLLDRDPARRYPNATAVRHDLRRRRARAPWRIAWTVAIAATVLVTAFAILLIRNSAKRWTHDDLVKARAVVVHRRGLPPVMAGVAAPPGHESDWDVVSILSFVDPQTGELLQTRTLPAADNEFQGFSADFGLRQILAVDLDGDGWDEVVVGYIHRYWPCFYVVYDVRRNESRVVFVASGQHVVVDTEDVDGDGVRELIVAGILNKMGWYTGIGAVRVSFGVSSASPGQTPDREGYVSPVWRPMLWYSMLPALNDGEPESVSVDRSRRIFRVAYATRPPVEVSFAGVVVGSGSSLAVAERLRLRESAYAHLREATRLDEQGFVTDALSEVASAQDDSRRADEPLLVEWCERVHARMLVHTGRMEEAQRAFTDLAARSERVADISTEAGDAFYLAGQPERAIPWYRRGLGPKATLGKLKYEDLQGLVFALGEKGQWPEALRAADAFGQANKNQRDLAAWYRRYCEWRLGLSPPHPTVTARNSDILQYWGLELDLDRGDPADVLARIDGVEKHTSFLTALLLSCRSEAFRRLGRKDEALKLARMAFSRADTDRRSIPEVRAHFDLIQQRLERLSR